MNVKEAAKGVLLSIIGTPLGAKQYYKEKEIKKKVSSIEKEAGDNIFVNLNLVKAIDIRNNYFVLEGLDLTTIEGELLKAQLEINSCVYDKIAPFTQKRNYDKYFMFSNEKNENGFYTMLSFGNESEAINKAQKIQSNLYRIGVTGKFKLVKSF